MQSTFFAINCTLKNVRSIEMIVMPAFKRKNISHRRHEFHGYKSGNLHTVQAELIS